MSTEIIKQQQEADNSQWESLSTVEFANNKPSREAEEDAHDIENGDIQEGITKIKTILDTEAVAKQKDPDGLAESRKKDQDILASCTQRRKELEHCVSEYELLSKEQSEYLDSGKCSELLQSRASRERSLTHKVLSFLHRPDKTLDGIVAELTKAEKRVERIIELAYAGYSDEQGIEAKRLAIDEQEKTAVNEEEFIRNYDVPLSREQKDELLGYDVLAKLSTDEYLQLWRHLNPQYVSHVTRQGYRDHSNQPYHTAGMGEMHKGFTENLKSGKALRSFIGIKTGASKTDLLDDEKVFRSFMEDVYFKDGIPKSLLESKDLSPKTIASAMSSHGVLCTPDGFWRDRTAVHVGVNNVLNRHYGAETGNEIFYVFPADVVLSQSGASEGLLHQSKRRPIRVRDQEREIPYTEEETHNDACIFVQDSLPLNAGLVFLPESVLVDPNTGSKYHDFDSETMVGTVMTKEMGGIPSKKYWERYFKEHPEEKPAHIIYYDGNPETAVARVLAENGIYVGNPSDTSGETGYNLGFDDRIACGGTELDKQLCEETKKFYAKVANYIHSER